MALNKSGLVAKVLLVGSMFVAQHAAAAAVQLEMTVDGTKQGKFKGETTVKGAPAGSIPLLGFVYESTSPIDAASGQATGRRQHKPLSVSKDLGAASPQILQALVTNEVLHNVTIEMSSVAANGKPTVIYRIIMTNVQIVDLTQTAATAAAGGVLATESVQFVYQTLEEEHIAAGTTAIDAWQTPG